MRGVYAVGPAAWGTKPVLRASRASPYKAATGPAAPETETASRIPSQLVVVAILASLTVIALVAPYDEEGEPPNVQTTTRRAAPVSVRDEPIRPLPPRPELDPTLLRLGRDLFHDPRLSTDGTISCASCHMIPTGGDDGRAADLAAQAEGPLLAENEMGWLTWEPLLAALRAEPDLVARFAEAFPERGLTRDTVLLAITTFEEWLLTPDAPFDRWLAGDDHALSADALAGYGRFKDLGCIACHQGRNVGGNMFQRIGRAEASPFEGATEHAGRFDQTGAERDLHRFKVPSLRNASRTAPYLHDGSLATLPDAIRFMGRYQLGLELDDNDVRLIEAFIQSLEGELPNLAELD